MPWEPLPGAGGDPERLSAGLDAVMARLGGPDAATWARIVADWPAIVGADLAETAEPVRVDDGTLIVAVTDGVSATELRFRADRIRREVMVRTGTEAVTAIRTVVRPRGR